MTKFSVYSRKEIQLVNFPAKYAVISISDTLGKPLDYSVFPETEFRAILSQQFDDTEFERNTVKTITYEQAVSIIDFVKTFYETVDEILIHCVAGRSRSAAVAAALSHFFEGRDAFSDRVGPDGELFYSPNRLVYKRLTEAWLNQK